MPEFADKGHRDHARHTGETPTTEIDFGPRGLTVTLDQWGPWDADVMNRYLNSNWGERPMTHTDSTIERQKNAGHLPTVEACLNGKTLQQILEGVSFWFTIDGCCRPATHQIVRTRNAAFMQHGGRDNDWRHRRFTLPETIHRLCRIGDQMADSRPTWEGLTGEARRDAKLAAYAAAIDNHGTPAMLTGKEADPLFELLDRRYPEQATGPTPKGALLKMCQDTVQHTKELYAALVDAGIPWEDARRFLPMGLQTYIHGIYNFVSLKRTLEQRLEFIMDWEYNCIAQLMVRAIWIKCPAIVAAQFMSASDRARKAAFAGLESWPPDGKYPNPHEKCGYLLGDFLKCGEPRNSPVHRSSEVDSHEYEPTDSLKRAHRPEQNPFWVLTEDALHGGPVEWIQTNGTYPHDNPKAPKAR